MKYALLFLFVCPLSFGEVLIRVRPHVVAAPGSEVRLGQIVDAPSISAAGQKQIDEISLSVAPADGERQELAEAAISAALRPVVQAERARNSDRVRVVIPKMVIIDTLKRDIDEDTVKSELLQAWQPLCADCKLEIEALMLPRVAGIRDWTLKLKSDLPKGSFSIPVEVIRSNGTMTPAWVSGRLLAKKKVPVVKRMMNINDRIASEDIAWEYRDTSYAYDGIPAADELVGRRMKQGLRNGEIVFRGMIEKEKAVHRGDLVTAKSGDGIWEVSMSAIAQQDAAVGDVVNLKHPKTNVALVGLVTGQGEVEIK